MQTVQICAAIIEDVVEHTKSRIIAVPFADLSVPAA